MSAHPLNGEMGFAGIGGTEHSLHGGRSEAGHNGQGHGAADEMQQATISAQDEYYSVPQPDGLRAQLTAR